MNGNSNGRDSLADPVDKTVYFACDDWRLYSVEGKSRNNGNSLCHPQGLSKVGSCQWYWSYRPLWARPFTLKP
jgi:hypothetical protein